MINIDVNDLAGAVAFKTGAPGANVERKSGAAGRSCERHLAIDLSAVPKPAGEPHA
ncbi:MAG: hypothetical protein J2P50_20295 [Hyphomicrobiaceae bacterium]|nr:hypothetical protein [Hyphomicrobiaceae bacterium]